MFQDLHQVKLGVNYRLGTDPAAGVYASAAPGGSVFKAPELGSDWSIEAGARYFVSGGRKAQDLYDAPRTDGILSRLTYTGMTGHAAEIFARLDHRDGMFVKGNFGLGDLRGGQMNDEDFPPFTQPYSNTISVQRDSRLRYGSLDVGHDIIKGPGGELGAYVGYRQLYENGLAFGCAQVALAFGCVDPAEPTSFLGITGTETWRGAAVGLNTPFHWRTAGGSRSMPPTCPTWTSRH